MIEKLRRMLAPRRNDWAGRSKETLQSGVWIAPGFACIGLAAVAHFVLARLIHDFAPSILYNAAIFCVTVWAGIPAGLLALGLSTSLMLLMLLGLNSFGLESEIPAALQAIDLTIFALVAILIIWIGGRYRALGVPCPQQGNEYRSDSGLFLKLHRFLLDGVPPNSFSAYIFAILCIGVATLIRSGFALSSGNIMPLVSYYPAVLLSALIGGAGAGLFAIVASLVAVWSEYPGSFFSAGVPARDESVSLAVYVFGSLLSVWIAENHRPGVHGKLAQQSRTLEALASVLVAFSGHPCDLRRAARGRLVSGRKAADICVSPADGRDRDALRQHSCRADVVCQRAGGRVFLLSSQIQLLRCRSSQRCGIGIFSAARGYREQGCCGRDA
jgi:hypothetical protein